VVFDDGSESAAKDEELEDVASLGAEVVRARREGFGRSWIRMAELAASRARGKDSVVVLEDDVVLSSAWLDVLAHMFVGASARCRPGLMSCFRHWTGEWGERTVLDGVEAVASRFNTTQANIMPVEVMMETGAFERADGKVGPAGGFDVRLGEELGRMGLRHFATVRSYAMHGGAGRSVVAGQGLPSFPLRGVNVVSELDPEMRTVVLD
jgi:hypothetical protein